MAVLQCVNGRCSIHPSRPRLAKAKRFRSRRRAPNLKQQWVGSFEIAGLSGYAARVFFEATSVFFEAKGRWGLPLVNTKGAKRISWRPPKLTFPLNLYLGSGAGVATRGFQGESPCLGASTTTIAPILTRL